MAAKKPSGRAVYLCGLGATLVVYAVFYLRNPKVLTETFLPLSGAEVAIPVAASIPKGLRARDAMANRRAMRMTKKIRSTRLPANPSSSAITA